MNTPDEVTAKWDGERGAKEEIKEPKLVISIKPEGSRAELPTGGQESKVPVGYEYEHSDFDGNNFEEDRKIKSSDSVHFVNNTYTLTTEGYINITPLDEKQSILSCKLENNGSSDQTDENISNSLHQKKETATPCRSKSESTIKKVHKGIIIHDELFECARCSWKCLHVADAETHVKNKKCGKQNEYLCCICETSYVALCSLRRHVRESHFCKNPFECDICGRLFRNKGAFTLFHIAQKPRSRQLTIS